MASVSGAAVATAVQAHGKHGTHAKHEDAETLEARAEKRHSFFARGPTDLSPEEARRQKAAISIQNSALKRLVDCGVQLKRTAVIERLKLEANLMLDMRLLLLCLLMFTLVVASCLTERPGPQRLGLLRTFKEVFYLDDSLSEIKTIQDLQGYLRTVTEQARLLQPVSDYYFKEPEGEIRVFEGVTEGWTQPLVLNIRDLRPRIDTLEWTMTAWVQLESEGGGYIIRKPLGQTPETRELSCWAWYMGWPQDKFEFGAHDYRGGSDAPSTYETLLANGTVADDGTMHFIALVVRLDNVQIWVDSKLSFESALPREVTDCDGNVLMLGDDDMPVLGDLTFYPRALKAGALQEIMSAGFTLEALAEGRAPYTPTQELADTIITRTDEDFENAKGERRHAAVTLQVESAVSRNTVEITVNSPTVTTDPTINVTKKGTCTKIPCFGNDTSCRIIDDWTGAIETDAVNNKQFFNLVPPAARPAGLGSRARIFVDHTQPQEYLRYDSTAWPSFCGKSATFSMWVETDTVHGGALLSRYSVPDSHNVSNLEYALYADSDALVVKGDRAESSHVVPDSLLQYGQPLEKMKYGMQRHVAFVFDNTTDTTKTYLDGSLLGITKHPTGTINKLDCDLNQDTAYTGLGHLAPGVWGLKGAVQDWRYYRGYVLSADELYKLAEDKTGPAKRSCQHDDEGGDTTWTDIYGHDCAWYYVQKKKSPGVCSTADVKKNCPVACGAKLPCFETHDYPTHYYLFDRIVKFEDANHHKGAGLICARAGVDLVAKCRDNSENPDTSKAPGATGSLIPANGAPYEESYMDINITDCDRIEFVVEPYCAFQPSRVDADVHRRSETAFNNDLLMVVGGRRSGESATATSASTASACSPRRGEASSSSVMTTGNPGCEKEWGRDTNKEIKQQGGYTIEFWVNIDSRTTIPNTNEDYKSVTTSMRRILFLSKVSPPRVIAAITLRQNFEDLEFQAFGNCYEHNKAKVSINFPEADPLTNNNWVKITMVYGTTNENGKRGIRIMQGAQSAFQYMSELEWCESDDEFIQAIQAPGGILMSPVEITLAPLPIKVLQERYYHQKPLMDVRKGPKMVDKKRKTGTIPYDLSEFTYPVNLIAPPVVFQKRKEETVNCSTIAGTDYTMVLWNETTMGEKCSFPYDCGDELMNDQTKLLRCKASTAPNKFFGATKVGTEHPAHEGKFFEFLQTVASAHMLKRLDQRRRMYSGGSRRTAGKQSFRDIRRTPFVHGSPVGAQSHDRPGSRRASAAANAAGGPSSGAGSSGDQAVAPPAPAALNDKPGLHGSEGFTENMEGAISFDPGNYLDFQTQQVDIYMATFSAEYGIASLIKVTALVSSEVEVDFQVIHYQAAEGQRLADYNVLAALIIILAVIILLEKIVVMCYKDHEERRKAFAAFAFDVVLQVLLPVTYTIIRVFKLSESGRTLDESVGPHGLAGIPWEDPDVMMSTKVGLFLHALDVLEEEVEEEVQLSLFYLVIAAMQLFRLLYATKAHPRIAILVRTLTIAIDDLAHFSILFLFLIGGYMALGHSQFGGSRPEFEDFESSFRTLWEMMLGSMLGSGQIGSSAWTNDVPLLVYQLSYNILMFLILLNFIIAIIVDAYVVVKEEVKASHSEQAFWTDAVSLIRVSIQSMMMGWPGNELLIDSLSQSQKNVLDYCLLRQLFPNWRNMSSIRAWLHHYALFDFLAIDFDEDSDDGNNVAMKAHISDELSLMLGVSPPTMFERILERKRLNLIGNLVRERRKEAAEKQTPDVPSIQWTNSGVLSPRGTKHKRKQTKLQAEEEQMRLQKKKDKLLRQEIPSSFVIRENAAEIGETARGAFDRAPQWVAEVVGKDMATKLGGALKELAIDARLLLFFDHDSWKMVGVEDPILRCRLLQCQQREKVTPTIKKGDSVTRVPKIPSSDEVETLGHDCHVNHYHHGNDDTNGSRFRHTKLMNSVITADGDESEATLNDLVQEISEATAREQATSPKVSVPGELDS